MKSLAGEFDLQRVMFLSETELGFKAHISTGFILVHFIPPKYSEKRNQIKPSSIFLISTGTPLSSMTLCLSIYLFLLDSSQTEMWRRKKQSTLPLFLMF